MARPGNRHCCPDLEQLLDALDGDAQRSSKIKQHLGSCVKCQDESFRIEQLRVGLRALPVHRPDEHNWQQIVLLRNNAAKPRWSGYRQGLLAIAATLVLAVAIAMFALPRSAPKSPEFEQLVQQSQQLEQILRHLDHRSQVMDLKQAGLIAQYQDQIAYIDLAIGTRRQWNGNNQHQQILWRQRNHLMQDLVQLKTASFNNMQF